MSTQLILYPQSYEGEYNSIATPVNFEFITNGILFTGFNSTSLYNTTSQHPSEDAITQQPPTILGDWYRFTTTGGDYGAVTEPTYALGAVQLSHNAINLGQTGIYQKLSQLIVWAVYDVKISIVTPQNELLTFEMYDGTVIYHQATLSANTSVITTTFTAQSSNDIFLIYYEGVATNLSVSKISVKQSAINPSLIYTELNDGQVICDLYQEEDIPLTLSIDDFKNVAEQVKSYSKDFNLPATKRNNQIFNNMFEVTRADDGLIFNPYVKTQCVLKEDGFILFEGYLRLIDVKDKEGEISYNVNLYSEVVALADVLKDATFSDLDFTELTHDYNKQEIKRSWNESPASSITYLNSGTSGFRETYDTLRYPFIDWTHQFIIADGLLNLATIGNPELTSLETSFRPCIQLKYLINRIFAASGFNFTSNFFNTTDFGKLYMDFNWGADNAPNDYDNTGSAVAFGTSQLLTTSFAPIETNAGSFPASFGYSHTGGFTAPNDNASYTINTTVYFRGSSGATLEAQWLHTSATGVTTVHNYNTYAFTGTYDISVNPDITIPLALNDTLVYQAKATGGTINVAPYTGAANPDPVSYYGSITVNIMTNSVFLQTLRGELGQWDFLKGIMTMFNLVSMVDENDPDNILIEPYADVFINNTRSNDLSDMTLASRFDGKIHDWTEKIDASEMELKPLTDLNKNTIFQFVEDEDDYTFRQYKNSTSGHLYGSKEIDASGFTILEGTKEIIAEPFAATVSKPLDDQFSQFITPAIYSMTDDGTSEGFDNSPRVFYNNGIKSTGASYYIPEQNGLTSENQPDFLQFSHLTDVPTIAGSRDFVFESTQLFSPIGNSPTDNLYNTYWSPYFNELYNADTRTMTLKVNLSPSDVASFKFYDTVFIKNRVFRVNKIEYKPNDLATVEFILIP